MKTSQNLQFVAKNSFIKVKFIFKPNFIRSFENSMILFKIDQSQSLTTNFYI